MFRAGLQRAGVFDNSAAHSTDNKLWKFGSGDAVASSPVIHNRVAYVGSNDGNLDAVDITDGAIRWKYATSDVDGSSPAVDSGTVYVGSNDNNLYAVDVVTGSEKWRFKTGGRVSGSPG